MNFDKNPNLIFLGGGGGGGGGGEKEFKSEFSMPEAKCQMR